MKTFLLSLILVANTALAVTERPEDRWNLADLYPSLAAWQADAAKLDAQLEAFAACRSRLGESARRLKACLDAFTDFSKRAARLEVYAQALLAEDTGVPESLELGAFLSEVHSRFDPALQSRVRLQTPDFVHVRGDRRLLEIVVVNLVDNARKYGPEEGTIEVSVAREGSVGLIRVRDDGDGIPDGNREAIFKPFRRGWNAGAHEGSGLGLYLSRQLAERHGGRLELEPSAHGTLFALSLPLA